MIKYILLLGFLIFSARLCAQVVSDSNIVIIEDDSKIVKEEGSNKKVATWVYILTSNDGDKWFLKNEAVSVENGIVQTWVKAIFKNKTWNKKTYTNSYMLTLIEFGLSEKKTKTLANAAYQSNGSVIFSKEFPYAEYKVVYPDSVLDGLFKKVKSTYSEN